MLESKRAANGRLLALKRAANGRLLALERSRYIVSDVQTKEACNKDDNYDDADDVENVHCVLRLR